MWTNFRPVSIAPFPFINSSQEMVHFNTKLMLAWESHALNTLISLDLIPMCIALVKVVNVQLCCAIYFVLINAAFDETDRNKFSVLREKFIPCN